MKPGLLWIVRAGCVACMGLGLACEAGYGADPNAPMEPPLAAKPYQIGIAPSHITKPTAPLFGERADDWDEVRKSIDFYKCHQFHPLISRESERTAL